MTPENENVNKHTIHIEDGDEEKIADLKEWYGHDSAAGVVRLALRFMHRCGPLKIDKAPPRFVDDAEAPRGRKPLRPKPPPKSKDAPP